MTTEFDTPACQVFCTAWYAASAVSYRPVSPPDFGTILSIAFSRSGRWVAQEEIGRFSFHGRVPTMSVENVQFPTDQRSSSSASPCRATARVTSARVRPPAVGTLAFIDADTSNTASIRPGSVIAGQLPSSCRIAAETVAGFCAAGGGTSSGALFGA